MLTTLESEVLKKIAEHQVISIQDLKSKIKDGKSNETIVDLTTRKLIEKKMIVSVRPIGSTCFAITQKGARAAEEMQ